MMRIINASLIGKLETCLAVTVDEVYFVEDDEGLEAFRPILVHDAGNISTLRKIDSVIEAL